MNITRRAFPSSKFDLRTVRPVVTSGRAKSGASVPRASIVEVPANSGTSSVIESPIVATRAVGAVRPAPPARAHPGAISPGSKATSVARPDAAKTPRHGAPQVSISWPHARGQGSSGDRGQTVRPPRRHLLRPGAELL